MQQSIVHPQESTSNQYRHQMVQYEPKSLRTYTPTAAVIAKSAGIFHWTPEGKKLYDFSSGVLVANLGHSNIHWLKRFQEYLQWSPDEETATDTNVFSFIEGIPLSAYNVVTPVEMEATQRLIDLLQSKSGGNRLQQVLWAASGSEAVQKALWAALARDRTRPMILATRFGFHGKKGLAGATTGSEADPERDPRVRFISFPMQECQHISQSSEPFDTLPYQNELESLYQQFGRQLGILITEPYLGGGGSYHPPKEYLQLLQAFCRQHDVIFILDEVQSNFGRTANMFAYETYGIEPDVVVLGKGLANGVPGAAAVGPASLFDHLQYGEGSDTYSANPLTCAAVLATLDVFEQEDILAHTKKVSPIIEQGLLKLTSLPWINTIRGEQNGMVWGVETNNTDNKSANDVANAIVLSCYRGIDNQGIHLLGPLAGRVIRIAPPLVITEQQAQESLQLMYEILSQMKLA